MRWPEYGEGSVFVLVHPDSYALSKSRLVQDVRRYTFSLCSELSRFKKMNMALVVLGLDQRKALPDFLQRFELDVDVIPNLIGDDEGAQALRLSEYLITKQEARQVVFSGGWKNACLKHTINTFLPMGERTRFVDSSEFPKVAQLTLGKHVKEITLDIDSRFIF